jgi:prefoldin alpha subunit
MSQEMEMGIAQMDQIKAQIDSYTMQRDSLGTVVLDYERSIKVLESMEAGSSDDILLPIGGQVYVKAKILDIKNCLVDQGVGVMMDRTISEAMDQIAERKEKVLKAVTSLEKTIQDLMARYSEISSKTQQLYSDQMKSDAGPEQTF